MSLIFLHFLSNNYIKNEISYLEYINFFTGIKFAFVHVKVPSLMHSSSQRKQSCTHPNRSKIRLKKMGWSTKWVAVYSTGNEG